MPDTRTHRGPAPEDARLFGVSMWPRLRLAVQDLCWLLNRGYAVHSAAELVGNRHALTTRQRLAVMRCVCSDLDRDRRREHERQPPSMRDQELWLDGFNVLTGIEAALAGGVLLAGCDGCYRDLASVYARHHEVQETVPALELLGTTLREWGLQRCHWWLDRPVSNSGRLQRRMLELAAARGWNWQVELVFNPDKVLAEAAVVIATSDSAILNRCQHWINLVRLVTTRNIPKAWVVDLSRAEPGS